MGDYYVRQEFKHHHDSPQLEFYLKFYTKWNDYYEQMRDQGVHNAARHISEKEESMLTNDQK